MKIFQFCLALFFVLSACYLLADDVDDLFQNFDETNNVYSHTTEKTENKESSEEETQETVFDVVQQTINKAEPLLTGSVSLSASLVAGSRTWNFSDTVENVSMYYTMGSALALDVRPSNAFRFFTSVGFSFNKNTHGINAPSVSELFIDFTLLDTVFFRIGKQNISWGVGRIIANPGNIVSHASSKISLKTFIPLAINGLTFMVYPTVNSSSPLDFTYAGLFDITLDPITLGVSAKFNRALSHSFIADVYMKTTLLGMDLALELRGDFDVYPGEDDHLPKVQVISNFFWEAKKEKDTDVGVQVLGEYYFQYGHGVNTHTAENTVTFAKNGEHIIALGFVLTKVFANNWEIGVLWTHHVTEESGRVIPGITGTVVQNIDIDIALPIIYGNSYGYYARKNEDPQKRVISVITQLTLNIRF